MKLISRYCLFIIAILLVSCAPVKIGGDSSSTEQVGVLEFICDPEVPVLSLTMFNVSQGQSILLSIPASRDDYVFSPSPFNMVYDAGPRVKGKPLPAIIDQLVISNPDADHMNGAAWILDTKVVKKFIESDLLPCTTNTCAVVRDKVAKESGIEVVTKFAGDRIYKGDTPKVVFAECERENKTFCTQIEIPTHTITIDYLSPDPTDPFKNDNDNSVVLLITYANTTILFMGDCEASCENALIEKHYPRDVDVLVVGHHGSKTSSSENFLLMVNPKIALISVGKNNQYGHPDEEVIARLERTASVYRTDEDGDILLTTNGVKVNIGMNEVKA